MRPTDARKAYQWFDCLTSGVDLGELLCAILLLVLHFLIMASAMRVLKAEFEFGINNVLALH